MKRALPLVLALLAFAPLTASALARVITHQGRLLRDNDTPVDGPQKITFRIWKAPTFESTGGRDAVWTSELDVQCDQGHYGVLLGDVVTGGIVFPPDAFEGDRWFSATIDGTELKPRQRLGMVPNAGFADEAAHAVEADHAKDADDALRAVDAEEAVHAIDADEALHALDADEAVHALDADEAVHALDADEAVHAVNADKAIAATTAGDLVCATPPCVSNEEIAAVNGTKVTAATLPLTALAPIAATPATIANLEKTHSHDAVYYRKDQFGAAGDAVVDWKRLGNVAVGPGLLVGANNVIAPKFGTSGTSTDVARADHDHGALYLKSDGSQALTGKLALFDSLPNSPLHAVSKGYADATLAGAKLGRLHVRGTGSNFTGSQARDVVLNGVDAVGDARGLSVTTINRTTHAVVATRNYDTHGLAADVTAMVTYLNSLDSTVFVVIASFDAWTTELTPAARLALARVGGSQLVTTINGGCCDLEVTGGRTSYALVGIPGRGLGSGLERSIPSVQGVAELDVLLVGTELHGQGDQISTVGFWSATQTVGVAATNGGPFVDVPGAVLTVPLARRSLVRAAAAFSMNANTNNNHCGFRFVVDNVGHGNGTYGDAIQMGVSGTHWQSVSDEIHENLPAGIHTFGLQIRANDTGHCGIEAIDYSRALLSVTAYPY